MSYEILDYYGLTWLIVGAVQIASGRHRDQQMTDVDFFPSAFQTSEPIPSHGSRGRLTESMDAASYGSFDEEPPLLDGERVFCFFECRLCL